MDFIYDDGPKDLSLQSLTTTIVIQKILEDEGMLPNCERDEKTIASRAKEVVNNLPLPPLLKWQLRRMVLPIMEEMQSWYHDKDEATRVVLSQNGTVDLPKSIRNLLNNENVSLMQRFKVACAHCLEQEIFDIGAQFNCPHYFSYWDNWSLVRIWYRLYEGNFHAKLGRKDISEYSCKEGFIEAFVMRNSAGVNYFMEGVFSIELGDHIDFSYLYGYPETLFTPEACIKIFKRLNEDEKQRYSCCFYVALLEALLKWPYQHQFLKAAKSLALHLDSDDFWSLAARIVKKARDGWEDHDYKGLFIDFWKLGSESKISDMDSVGYAKDVLYDVILMRDERLAHFVIGNTTEEFKTHYLFNCSVRSVCLFFIIDKHFEALEFFMEVCRVNNDRLIVKFQKNILEYLSSAGVHVNNVLYDHSPCTRHLIREFLSRMDKLKPQMSEISI